MAKIDRFSEAALRQKIIDALKIDLIGPVEPNEVMDQDPASEYLTGMIYAKSLADDLEFGEQEVGFDFAHEDDYSTGAEEENDDVQTNGKFEKPSSIGLSFYVKKETKVVKVVASWGDYKKREEHLLTKVSYFPCITNYRKHYITSTFPPTASIFPRETTWTFFFIWTSTSSRISDPCR